MQFILQLPDELAMLKSTLLSLIFAAAMLSGCANTSQQRISPDEPLAVSVEEFRAEMRQLQADLRAGEQGQLNDSEWTEFNRIQQGLERALANVSSIDELSVDDRVRLYNLQEDLAVLLGDTRKTDQLYCTRNRRTGTNITVTDCRTREQLALDRQASADELRKFRARDRGIEVDQF